MGVPRTKDNGFYSEEDLIVGKTMNLYGRLCLITGADRSTRKFYKEKYGITFPARGWVWRGRGGVEGEREREGEKEGEGERDKERERERDERTIERRSNHPPSPPPSSPPSHHTLTPIRSISQPETKAESVGVATFGGKRNTARGKLPEPAPYLGGVATFGSERDSLGSCRSLVSGVEWDEMGVG